MPPAGPFEFLDVALPPDGDLRLALAECTQAEDNPWRIPPYTFAMQGSGGEYIGRIRLRVGWSEDVIRYAGHVGYAVEPPHRGHRYAERACRLIIPLAKRHGMTHLWITCQPDNMSSRRGYPLDAGAERKKMCFRLALQ
jgi:predicted acetyltransferase